MEPGFHMIVTVSDALLRQARGHIRDGCVKWKHFSNDFSYVADQVSLPFITKQDQIESKHKKVAQASCG